MGGHNPLKYHLDIFFKVPIAPIHTFTLLPEKKTGVSARISPIWEFSNKLESREMG
jgi:hypothetical protein